MRITIDPHLFDDPAHSFGLTRLLTATAGRPHQVLVGRGGGEDLAAFGRWRDAQGPGIRAPLTQLINAAFNPEFARFPPSVRLRVSDLVGEGVSPTGDSAVALPERAAKLVEQPLLVVVENDVNDGAFLRTVAPPGASRDWLERALARDYLRFHMGGGSTMPAVLSNFGPWQRLRCFAMCDRDSWLPSGLAAKPAIQVQRCSAAAAMAPKVPLHVLQRRSIENYLPIQALRRWAALRFNTDRPIRRARGDFVSAFTSLAAIQPPLSRFVLRHCYHIERGFSADKQNIPKDYDSFRQDSYLSAGAGDGVKSIWSDNLAAKESQGAWIDDAWFVPDGQRPEVLGLLNSIKRRL